MYFVKLSFWYWVVCCCPVTFSQTSLAHCFLSFTAANTASINKCFAGCSAVTDRVSLLERRVRELKQLLSARNMGTADSVSPGPDSRPASLSIISASPAQLRHGRWRRSKSPVTWHGQRHPSWA